MKAKDYLLEIRTYKKRLENVKKQAEQLREAFSYLQGVSYDRDKVQTMPRDSMSEDVIAILDLEREVEKAARTYQEELNKRIMQINGLSRAEHITILTERYINDENFETISCNMNYGYYHICHLHGEALKEFSEKYHI